MSREDGVIDVDYDPETGIITSRAAGLLSVADVERSGREVRAAMAKARAQFGRALHLVDARLSVVQPREVAEVVERDGSFLSHPDDRQAIVAPTSLSTMQSRRLFPAPNERTFPSIEEAIAWLREG